MALVFLPSQLESRAEFYPPLGSMLSAGVTITKALEVQLHSPPHRSLLKPISILLESIQRGSTFTEGVQATKDWIPSFDLALIHAGEESGRLNLCCTLLASYYHERAKLARNVISDLTYPLFVLHFAVFIAPFPNLFLTGNLTAYATQTIGVLAPLYVAVLLVMIACQGRNGKKWRSVIESILHRIPILGKGRRNLALARLAASLEALLNAGVGIIEAWDLAASASGSPALEAAVAKWKPKVLAGSTPSDVMRSAPEFPDMFTNLYHTAEISGQLDQTMGRLHAYHQEEGVRQIGTFCKMVPKLFFLLIALAIAHKVLSFWTGYFNDINKLTQ